MGIATFSNGLFTNVATDTGNRLAEGSYRFRDQRTVEISLTSLIRQTTSAVLLSRMTPEDPETTHDEASTPADEAVIRAELHDHLDRAVGRCADDERALIDALYHRDLNMHAYAAELGVSVSTVSRRHARLLRKLGTLMPDATGPP